jgi:hypothetical protein
MKQSIDICPFPPTRREDHNKLILGTETIGRSCANKQQRQLLRRISRKTSERSRKPKEKNSLDDLANPRPKRMFVATLTWSFCRQPWRVGWRTEIICPLPQAYLWVYPADYPHWYGLYTVLPSACKLRSRATSRPKATCCLMPIIRWLNRRERIYYGSTQSRTTLYLRIVETFER